MLVCASQRKSVALPTSPTHVGGPDEFGIRFDDDGFGVIASADWSADIDDVLPGLSFHTAAGGRYLLTKEVDGTETLSDMLEDLAQFETAIVSVASGIAMLKLEFRVAHFMLPRADGSRVLWDMLAMYKALGLIAHRGAAWRWVARCWPLWCRMQAAGLGVASRAAQVAVPSGAEREHDRILTNSSVSTPLFLAVLTRMLLATRTAGGTQDNSARVAVTQVLHVLLCFAAKALVRLSLVLERNASLPLWPAPWQGRVTGALLLHPDGTCELEDGHGLRPPHAEFFEEAGLLSGRVPLIPVLVGLADARRLASTLLQ